MDCYNQALNLLRSSLNDPKAGFHDDQWECIRLLMEGKKALVVQRTGWGKSMVYFISAKLLRQRGSGPVVIISPLLSLMRNQIEAAKSLSLKIATINCSNIDSWTSVECAISANNIDVLIISPERLNNAHFNSNILPRIHGNISLLVIDEAHCVSDWGHDFRPDYRRIARVVSALPANTPILATTATANNRVVKDIQAQLGCNLVIIRGSLTRKSLKLHNITMPDTLARMAWMAETIPSLPGSGIVYTLTIADADRVTQWLCNNGIEARSYHSSLDNAKREERESDLLRNNIKVLVATVALGMGFDKPDLGFVIHYQRPPSVVHYYQQVGRAGRAVSRAYGILLHGKEDDAIADYFIRNAFPMQHHIETILQKLNQSETGLSTNALCRNINVPKSKIEGALKFMSIESPAPVVKIDNMWQATAESFSYRIDTDRVEKITAIRRDEQNEMRSYMNHKGCLMSFLQDALDDASADQCGICANCRPDPLIKPTFNPALAIKAAAFLKANYQTIKPRKQWPFGGACAQIAHTSLNIPFSLQAEPGRALCLWGDAAYGQMVVKGKYHDNHFSDELVDAFCSMIKKWGPAPFPAWVTCVPSLNRPFLVPDFAQRVAGKLGLRYYACVVKTRATAPQKEMQNSAQQVKNLDGAFTITDNRSDGPCLLVDDMADSRWTITIIAALLRQSGCSNVFPATLALNSLGEA